MRNRITLLTMATTLAAGGAIAFAAILPFAGPASADQTNGPVTLQNVGTVAASTPYDSGQSINVVVAANSTFANSSGPIKVIECAAPGGVDPTDPHQCQSDTLVSNSGAAPDGSMTFSGFPVYSLPDVPTFGESGPPVCNVTPHQCVLLITTDQTTLTKPHLFSSVFQVHPDPNDSGTTNPGDGTPETPWAIALPLAGLAVVAGSTLYLRRRRHQAA